MRVQDRTTTTQTNPQLPMFLCRRKRALRLLVCVVASIVMCAEHAGVQPRPAPTCLPGTTGASPVRARPLPPCHTPATRDAKHTLMYAANLALNGS